MVLAGPDTTLLLLKADVSKAHRRIRILPSGWKYQVAQIDQQWWVNKVGTYGVASAQLYWGRMAALLLRLMYYAFPEVDWGFVFVDDFCWILRSTNCNSLTPALLASELEEDSAFRDQHMVGFCHQPCWPVCPNGQGQTCHCIVPS